MKLGEDQKLDQAVYLWFAQKRMEGVPISGAILREKALELNRKLHGETTFTASEGWKWRFCKRHGVRKLCMFGEKLSGDKEQADGFVVEFNKLVQEKCFSTNQIFNCDETGLNFRLLPDCTLAAAFEKSVAGRKKSKERVTLNLCSNVSGSIKLPIHLIGKAKQPRCFKGLDMNLLPVKYTSQKNAWMTTQQFTEWFHNDFVPTVREKLKALGEEPKAILVLDNCTAHPSAEELVSNDWKIDAKYLPANVTSLIQPMDQGVIQAVKKRYKRKLLGMLVIEEDCGMSIVDFLKGFNLRVVVDLVHESWTEITDVTLRKSWQKILPLPTTSTSPIPPEPILTDLYKLAVHEEEPVDSLLPPQAKKSRGCGVWRGLRIVINHSGDKRSTNVDDSVSIESFRLLFEELGVRIETDEIARWLDSDAYNSGVQTFTDDEICEFVSGDVVEEEEEEDEKEPCPVSNSDAASMFEKCLSWLEHQPEATTYSTSMLRGLHALAAKKRIDSIKQTKITSFFSNV